MMYDDVTVPSGVSIHRGMFFTPSACHSVFEGQGLGVRRRGRRRGRGKTEKWNPPYSEFFFFFFFRNSASHIDNITLLTFQQN